MLAFVCTGGPGAWAAARAARAGSPSRRRRARERPCPGCLGCLECLARRSAARHPHLGWQRCPLRPHPWSGPGAPSALEFQATLLVVQCHELPADTRSCKMFTCEDICSPYQDLSPCHAIEHIPGRKHFLANRKCTSAVTCAALPTISSVLAKALKTCDLYHKQLQTAWSFPALRKQTLTSMR